MQFHLDLVPDDSKSEMRMRPGKPHQRADKKWFSNLHRVAWSISDNLRYHGILKEVKVELKYILPQQVAAACNCTALVETNPKSKNKLNGLVVRVPFTNSSPTDCVFEVNQTVTSSNSTPASMLLRIEQRPYAVLVESQRRA